MSESLFTTQTPTGTDNADGSPGITFATTLQFAVSGQITHIRFFSTVTLSGNYQGAVWQVNTSDPNSGGGTLLQTSASHPSTDITSAGWNLLALSSPVNVVPGTLYRVGAFSDAGRYVNTASFFTSALTNGDITAPAHGTDPIGLGSLAQGTFAIAAALTYPYQAFSANSYFADVVFVAAGAGQNGSATLSAASSLTDAATQNNSGAVAMTAASALSATGSRVQYPAVSMGAAAALTTTGSVVQPAAAPMTAASTFTAAGVAAGFASAPLTAASALTAAATIVPSGGVTMAAASTLTAAAAVSTTAVVGLSAGSSLAVAAITVRPGAAALAALSDLATAADSGTAAAAALGAATTLTAAGLYIAVPAVPMNTSGVLVASGMTTQPGAVAMLAAALLTASLTGGHPVVRRPGILTAGSRRSALTAGTVRGPARAGG